MYQKLSAEEWEKRKAETRARSRESVRSYLRLQWRTNPAYREKKRANKRRHDAKRRTERQAIELQKDTDRIRDVGINRKKSHHKICPVLRLFPEMYEVARKELKRSIDARRDRTKARAKTRQWKKQNPAAVSIQRYRRRTNFKNAKADLTAAQWLAIKTAYRNRCAYCGMKKSLTQDHIIPVSKGGDHTASNIIPACRSCNSSKGARRPLVSYQQHLIV